VQEGIAPVLLEHLKAHYTGWTQKQGNPSDINTLIGTVADEAQRKHVTGLIEAGLKEGGKIVVGGDADGAFVHPTLFTDVKDDATLNIKEVRFGDIRERLPCQGRVGRGLITDLWFSCSTSLGLRTSHCVPHLQD
jgi:aldehyde dehydrogenase (NAD+)